MQSPSRNDGEERAEDEGRIKVVFWESEHGDPDVSEDEVLRHKVEKSEELLGDGPRLARHVVEGVVSLADSAKQDGYDTSQMEHLKNHSHVCAIFAWFLGQFCHLEICFFIHALTNATDDHKYSPLAVALCRF